MNAVYVVSSISLRVFLISYDLFIDLPSGLFPLGSPQQKLCAFIFFLHTCHMPSPSLLLLDHPSNTWWEKSRNSLSALVSSEMWLCSLVEQVRSLLRHWCFQLQDTWSRRFVWNVDTCLPDHTWSYPRGLRHDLITVLWVGPEALQSSVYWLTN
jgi:hypothetical protein